MYKTHKSEIQARYAKRNFKRVREREQRWIEKNFDWNLWAQSKRRARKAGIFWDLKREDIIIPEICPYLKVPITTIQGQGHLDTNASLDRIDNTKGYTKDNIMVISRRANSFKRDASKEELITMAKSILELFNAEKE